MVRRGEKILIAVLNPDFSLFIETNQTPHFIVDAEELVAFHVSILRVFRHPQLENGFIPAVGFAAAINCFKRRRFDFREMVTGVDRLLVGVREDELFIGRIPQCLDKFASFYLVISFSISTSCLRRWISATAEANRQGCFVDSVLGEQIDRG